MRPRSAGQIAPKDAGVRCVSWRLLPSALNRCPPDRTYECGPGVRCLSRALPGGAAALSRLTEERDVLLALHGGSAVWPRRTSRNERRLLPLADSRTPFASGRSSRQSVSARDGPLCMRIVGRHRLPGPHFCHAISSKSSLPPQNVLKCVRYVEQRGRSCAGGTCCCVYGP